jgi:hypothetical protein
MQWLTSLVVSNVARVTKQVYKLRSFTMPFKPNAARITIISGTRNTRISSITELKLNTRNNFTAPRSLVGIMPAISSGYDM